MTFIRRTVAAALLVSGIAVGVPWAVAQKAEAQEVDRLRGVLKEEKAAKPYRVGITLVHFVDDFWRGIAYGLADEAKRSGVEVVRIMGAGGYGREAEQIAQLETLSSLKLDAVILGAANYDGYDRAIRSLTDKGIKVIAVGVPVNSALVSFGVTIDEMAVGQKMADFICRENAAAKVAAIPGPNGPVWNRLRFDGFKKGAAACPGMQLRGGAFQGDTKIEDGLSQGSDLLIRHPDTDYVYAAAVSLGTGAALAAKRSGSKARVVSAAITDRTVELMNEGHIAMIVSEQPILMGRSAIQTLIRALEGKPLPDMHKGGPIPYPEFLVPLFELTAKDMPGYSLNVFDQPPPGWQVPSFQ